MTFTAKDYKKDFPIFQQHPQLIYLDSAATAQKPHSVIAAETTAYSTAYASPYRGLYDLAVEATAAVETTREKISRFIGAAHPSDIIFTSNATAALNLAAHIAGQQLQPGDEIILSVAEHHSNLLPFYEVARRTGARIMWIELDEDYGFPLEDFYRVLSTRTKIVAVAHLSNVLGSIAPLSDIVAAAHRSGAHVIVDAAQSGGHLPMNVGELDIDYAAFSGHKCYGPSGIGWLYAKPELVADALPLLTGGGSVTQVSRTQVQWQAAPYRFEAGTLPIAQILGLGATLDYLNSIGLTTISDHEHDLTRYAVNLLTTVAGLTVYHPRKPPTGGIISFTLAAQGRPLHSHDIAQLLNDQHIAVRAGHHCAQVLLEYLGCNDLTRLSFGIYTTRQDIDALIPALENAVHTLN